MVFIPNFHVKYQMLNEIDLENIEKLFSDIPKDIRINKLNLPNGLSQQDVEKKLREIGKKNVSFYDVPSFLGGGVTPHFIPAVVKEVVSRSEFLTSYTPYQSEASQGMLQSMFEYQSMICELAGVDVANCSLYDGATALGEAALMCHRVKNDRSCFIVARSVSWEKRSVLHNYVKGAGIKVVEAPFDGVSGKIDLEALSELIDGNVCGVYLENPNFFGVFESDLKNIVDVVHDKGSLLVVGINPVSLGTAIGPGELGVDIVIGEGRSLGNTVSFGGSGLGIFACKNKFLRQMPGRIISMTKDANDKRAFCMALQTREQHIRRGRATSNICTNEGLNALAAVVFLGWLGGTGLWELSQVNMKKAQQCMKAVCNVDGFSRCFDSDFFNEFVVKSPIKIEELNKRLLDKGIIGGIDVGVWYPELKDCLLFGVSEMHSDEMITVLATTLDEVVNQ